jgi:hypothetical protein
MAKYTIVKGDVTPPKPRKNNRVSRNIRIDSGLYDEITKIAIANRLQISDVIEIISATKYKPPDNHLHTYIHK